MKHYRHKEHKKVTCEVFESGVARFGKWVWKDGVCSEVYNFKDVTEDFESAFEEMTPQEFNEDWGRKLHNA